MRMTFEKSLIAVPGKPLAEFVCPGHPLLEAVTDIVLERYRNLLRTGAVLLDESDGGEQLRTLFYVDHSIQDARTDAAGNRRIVSRQMQFVEVDSVGAVKNAGAAPYLDYRPVSEQERALLASSLNADWVKSNLESQVLAFAVENLVPSHLEEVKQRKEELVDKTMAAVKDRLTKEVNYWDHRAEELKAQELAGRVNAKINSGKARQRADELQARLPELILTSSVPLPRLGFTETTERREWVSARLGNGFSSPRDCLCPLAHLSAPPSSPCAPFRGSLADGFGVNLTAAGLRQGTFAT